MFPAAPENVEVGLLVFPKEPPVPLTMLHAPVPTVGGRSFGRLGYVETIRHRRRAINGIKSTTGRNRNPSERAAVNTVIQGSAADLIKQAMITLDQRLLAEKFQSRMILQIHDELVFEGPKDEISRLAPLVNQIMVEAIALKVPLKVDVAIGPNWLDVEPWSPDTA